MRKAIAAYLLGERARPAAIATCFVTLSLCLAAQTANKPASAEHSGAVAVAARAGSPQSENAMMFRDVSREAGLATMPHSSTERRYVLETMAGGGIALFDCDNDGKLDIAVVNDSTVGRYLSGGDPMITLYRQDGKAPASHFIDVTAGAGLSTRGWGMAIAVGDYDNDGLPDLYVTGFGHNVLYRNQGGCRFEDVTARAGVAVGGFSTGAAWGDYDRDGKLDLYVARYVKFDPLHLPSLESHAMTDATDILQAPDKMEGETDVLFRNRGDGTFEDVSAKAKVDDTAKLHGMGVEWGDYDNDGWPDLFVTNDDGANYLYRNLQDGTFEEAGATTGAAFGPNGEIYGNMAGDFSDYDRDGRFDLVASRYSKQPVSLYHNDGMAFTDVAAGAGIARNTTAMVKWGAGFGDFDNDGWPDLLIANGNFSSLTDKLETEVRFREPLQLFRNLQGSSFVDVADQSGLNTGVLQSRRGVAFGDLNSDGNLDVVAFNVNAPPSLFLNESKSVNHRALFKLTGVKSNRMAIGARVTVTTQSMTQIDEVHGGSGYNSSSDTRLHFGLGKDAAMTKVAVNWPSGVHQEFSNVAADAIYTIDEEKGIRKTDDLKPSANR